MKDVKERDGKSNIIDDHPKKLKKKRKISKM